MRIATRGMMAAITMFVMVGALAIGAAARDDKNMKAGMNPDSKFMMEAAMGGMAEVKLGQLAVDKATSPDVKQFGQRMVDDHGKANQELMGLASQKGVTLPTDVSPKQQADMDKLSKLSGDAFDREYVKMMVEDHNKDVAAFQKEASSGKDPDAKAWAAKTLPTLQEHQSMAKSMWDGMKGGSKGDMKHTM